ncbi:uncharacterized protein EAF01_001271 [Botrytis porri]|uniref:Enoyl reductase (ER) domain-containing protein n=1 Tax=Botrytis porri TaxID=87229 RepID=A0A4Z1KAS2_9HELO|nr:uncharacterized protein EAF01_001271 [Botrytis porri]KAF7912250.1 hypothetical protein EAF01_001271 [Botrytis porri]TGO82518.1 hypothetical protein BPOR_0814g00040 [Botrytis porri]
MQENNHIILIKLDHPVVQIYFRKRIRSDPNSVSFCKSEPLGADEIEIEAHAAGVNYRDLLQVIGKGASDVYGCEGAGIVTRVGENCTQFCPGDRVTGRNVFRSYARCHWALAMKMPTNLTFPQAASIPVTFTTAWYSLNEVSSLQPGETVSIHSGAGGNGQALIQVAQLLGAEVFTTISSAKKKTIPNGDVQYSERPYLL